MLSKPCRVILSGLHHAQPLARAMTHKWKQHDRRCRREAYLCSRRGCMHLAFCLSFAKVVAVRCCSVKPCTFLCTTMSAFVSWMLVTMYRFTM